MQLWLQGSPLWNSSRPPPATEMREKLVVPEAEWSRAISELCGLNHIEEAVVLSTCNRMEIYVVGISHHRCVKEVTEWMSKLFGVALLEVITGRPTIDDSHKNVVMWAKPLLLSKNNAELVDLSLDDNYDWDELNCMVMVASLCIHQSSTDRPQMSKVCPFQLIVKHVSALLDDRDPIKSEVESKLTDLISIEEIMVRYVDLLEHERGR